MGEPVKDNLDPLQDTFDKQAELPEEYGISDDQIEDIQAALSENNSDAVEELLDELNAADTADLLEKVDQNERQTLIQHFTESFDADVFSELSADVRKYLLESLPAEKVAAYLNDLDSDDALDLIENLEPLFQKEIIRKLSGKDRAALEEGLMFPEESAGRLMQREFVAVPQFWTVGKTIDYLRQAGEELPEEFADIFVISPSYKVTGEIPINRILRAKRSEKIENLTLDAIHTIPAEMDQEEVAFIFQRENLTSAPVIDLNDRLIGVITNDDIIHVIKEEAEEDILRLGGVERDDLYSAILSTTKSRFSWLFINLLTAIAASIVIGLFEATIEQIVALAILLPIVASMGGNAGTQTLTVAVRALATKELSRSNAMRMISKEVIVGLLNGVFFAVIIGLVTWVWFSNPLLGGVIAAAMVVNMLTAGLFGICIPIVLDRLNIDPALASSVFLTTLTDIIGFFAFLSLAALILL